LCTPGSPPPTGAPGLCEEFDGRKTQCKNREGCVYDSKLGLCIEGLGCNKKENKFQCDDTEGCSWHGIDKVCVEGVIEDECPFKDGRKSACQKLDACEYNTKTQKCTKKGEVTPNPTPAPVEKPTADPNLKKCSKFDGKKNKCKENDSCVYDKDTELCKEAPSGCTGLDQKNCNKNPACSFRRKQNECVTDVVCRDIKEENECGKGISKSLCEPLFDKQGVFRKCQKIE